MRNARPIVSAHGKHRTLIGYGDYMRDYERGEKERLTLREFEILEAFSNGKTTAKDVALHLGISHWTVLHHTKIIRAKLGEHTTVGCVIRGLREGWLMVKGGDTR